MGTDSISGISDINAGDNDVSITVVSGKPPDLEYLQEIQRMAEIKYQEYQQEEEERYQGLTSLEKRKKIIEDTMMLREKESTGGGRTGKSPAVSSNTMVKEKSEKKDGRSKPPKSQRPKWQNLLDDDGDAKKEEEGNLNFYDGQHQKDSSTEKKTRNKHDTSLSNKNMLDNDGDQEDENSREDVQIIIKTDKHSKHRTTKRDIYESEYHESRINADVLEQQRSGSANVGFHTVNQSRDSQQRESDKNNRRKHTTDSNQLE